MASVTATITPASQGSNVNWTASITFPGSVLTVPVSTTLGQNFVSDRIYNPSTWTNFFPTSATITTGIQSPDGDLDAVRLSCNNTGNALLRISLTPFNPNAMDIYIVSFWARHISGSKTGCFSDLSDDGLLSTNYSSSLVTGQWVKITYSSIPTSSTKTFLDLFSDSNTNNVIDFWGAQVERITSSRIVANPNTSEMTLSSSTVSFQSFASPKYVTWRDRTISAQKHPQKGKSLDIWSDSLYDAINAGATYQTLVTTGTYNLNPNYWTVFYNYNVPYASHYGKGGTITFTTP